MYGSDFCTCASSYALCCYCKIDGKHKVTQWARAVFSTHAGVIPRVDRDFVPAAKLVCREGIDFILDPLWASIKPNLHEHIDGLRSNRKKLPAVSSQTEETQEH